MRKLTLIIILTTALNLSSALAQVAINTNGAAPDSSAMLDVSSTTKGMLVPRMTAAQRNAINNPAQGLMVYVIDDSTFYYYKKTSWIKIGKGASGWDVNGNYIYTLSDSVGIGTSSPQAQLEVNSSSAEKTLKILNNTNLTDPSSSVYGSYIKMSGTGAGFHYGTYQLFNNTGNGSHIGLWNELSGSSTGYQYGSIQDITNSGDGFQYATYNSLNGSGTGNKYGSYNTISNSAGGTHYGVYSDVPGHGNYAGYFLGNSYISDSLGVGVTSPAARLDVLGSFRYRDSNQDKGMILTSDADGNAFWANGDTLNGGGWLVSEKEVYNNTYLSHIGIGTSFENAKLAVKTITLDTVVSLINNSYGDDNQYGEYIELQGNGSGNHYGNYTNLWNTGSGNHYGSYNQLSGSGTGDHYGTNNVLYGNGTGKQYGTRNFIYNTADSSHYGIANVLSGSGKGKHFGNYSELLGSGSGNHYGVYNNLSGSGTGDKYGSFDTIPASAGGTHYGIYSAVHGHGNYAGYFNGNSYVSDSVGIGTTSPHAKLEVNGDIVVGSGTGTPVAGMIRWNSTTQDFEGYNGTEWVSLTKSKSGWGDNTIHETEGAVSSNGATNYQFGSSVSISGDYALVGEPVYRKAYIFYRSGTTWSQQETLTASDGAAAYRFGRSVSIDSNYAIVGASNYIGGNSDQGKAYIYHFNGTSWGDEVGLTATDGLAGDYFGGSVSIDGDYAIVGALDKDVGGNSHQGKAYIYHFNGTSWGDEVGLTASDGAANDQFSYSVSINGYYAIVGADYKDVGGNYSQGKAYIFHRSGTTWSEGAGLTASDGAAGDFFGGSVSINGDYAVVGAPDKDVGGNSHQGKIYFFNRN